jgi:DNA-binding CsgD family transcriptional regulator
VRAGAPVVHSEIASTQIIQGLFDLTPAEARIARGIAAGKTVDDLAKEAHLAVGTVRQQLKSVFGKTGVSRQAELVGILVGSALRSPVSRGIFRCEISRGPHANFSVGLISRLYYTARRDGPSVQLYSRNAYD